MNDQRYHADPERTQFIQYPGYQDTSYVPPTWAEPLRRNNIRPAKIAAAVIAAVLAVVGIITLVVVNSGPARLSSIAQVPTPGPAADTGTSTRTGIGSRITTAPDPAPNTEPTADPEPNRESNPKADTNSPGPIEGQVNNILNAAVAWMDARNAGDGNRTLQLGCQDDIDAVNSGTPNPASYAGYSSMRPTGNIAPIGTHGLAAYVETSSLNNTTGTATVDRTPIIWENGSWHICYYPGQRAQEIGSQG